MEAIRAFAGPAVDKAVVEPGAVAALDDFDDTVRHYEVIEEVSCPHDRSADRRGCFALSDVLSAESSCSTRSITRSSACGRLCAPRRYATPMVSRTFPATCRVRPFAPRPRRRHSRWSTAGTPGPSPPTPASARYRPRWERSTCDEAAVPIPLDNLATDADTGREASSAAIAIVPQDMHLPRHQKVWSNSGASMPCSRTSCSATTIVSPSITLAGPVRQSGRHENPKKSTRFAANNLSMHSLHRMYVGKHRPMMLSMTYTDQQTRHREDLLRLTLQSKQATERLAFRARTSNLVWRCRRASCYLRCPGHRTARQQSRSALPCPV